MAADCFLDLLYPLLRSRSWDCKEKAILRLSPNDLTWGFYVTKTIRSSNFWAAQPGLPDHAVDDRFNGTYGVLVGLGLTVICIKF